MRPHLERICLPGIVLRSLTKCWLVWIRLVLNDIDLLAYLNRLTLFCCPSRVIQPSVVVRPNPLLFQLTHDTTNRCNLPHRSIFAILTVDTVLIYDTIHDKPLAVARGLHYAGLTDAAWSKDGKTLFVTSSDGYVSILSFANGET